MSQMIVGIDARTALEDRRRGWARYAEEFLVALDARSPFEIRALLPRTETARFVEDRIKGTGAVRLFVAPYHPATPYPCEGEAESLTAERSIGAVDVLHSLTRFVLPTFTKCVLATVHDVCPIADPPFKLRLRDDTLKALEILRRPSHRVIAVSGFTKQELVERGGIEASKIDVIHLGVAEVFARIACESPPRPERPYVLYVGGAEENKNLAVLIEAMHMVRSRAALDLILAGDPSWGYERSIPSAHLGEGWMKLGRYVDDRALADLYRGAAMLVFPSLYEGFGLPVLEAMACGTPVIRSNIQVLDEISGQASLAFDPHRPEDLAEKIARVALDPDLARDLAARGRSVAAAFTWARTADETIRAYQRCSPQSP